MLTLGAKMVEMNCVRRHLSAIKGDRLATSQPARVITRAIFDVSGERPGDWDFDPEGIEEAKSIRPGEPAK